MDLELNKQSKDKLEEELLSKQRQIQQIQFSEKQLNGKVTELEYEILSKEKQLAASDKLLEVRLSDSYTLLYYLEEYQRITNMLTVWFA